MADEAEAAAEDPPRHYVLPLAFAKELAEAREKGLTIIIEGGVLSVDDSEGNVVVDMLVSTIVYDLLTQFDLHWNDRGP